MIVSSNPVARRQGTQMRFASLGHEVPLSLEGIRRLRQAIKENTAEPSVISDFLDRVDEYADQRYLVNTTTAIEDARTLVHCEVTDLDNRPATIENILTAIEKRPQSLSGISYPLEIALNCCPRKKIIHDFFATYGFSLSQNINDQHTVQGLLCRGQLVRDLSRLQAEYQNKVTNMPFNDADTSQLGKDFRGKVSQNGYQLEKDNFLHSTYNHGKLIQFMQDHGMSNVSSEDDLNKFFGYLLKSLFAVLPAPEATPFPLRSTWQA